MKTIDIQTEIEDALTDLDFAQCVTNLATEYFADGECRQLKILLYICNDYICSIRENLEKLVSDLSEKGAGQ